MRAKLAELLRKLANLVDPDSAGGNGEEKGG